MTRQEAVRNIGNYYKKQALAAGDGTEAAAEFRTLAESFLIISETGKQGETGPAGPQGERGPMGPSGMNADESKEARSARLEEFAAQIEIMVAKALPFLAGMGMAVPK